jgi:hypothetical protein
MEAYKLKPHQEITTKEQYLSGIQGMVNILKDLAAYSKEHPETNKGLLVIAHGLRHEANVIIDTLTKQIRQTTENTGE